MSGLPVAPTFGRSFGAGAKRTSGNRIRLPKPYFASWISTSSSYNGLLIVADSRVGLMSRCPGFPKDLRRSGGEKCLTKN
jgi:hypothetical protein